VSAHSLNHVSAHSSINSHICFKAMHYLVLDCSARQSVHMDVGIDPIETNVKVMVYVNLEQGGRSTS
jgi:hypothetical protein